MLASTRPFLSASHCTCTLFISTGSEAVRDEEEDAEGERETR